MGWFYRQCIRPVLFTQQAEHIHEVVMTSLGIASRSGVARSLCRAFYAAPELPVRRFGLTFPNPVGLAAGMDKDAAAVPLWPDLGFGFSELGAVTWHAQPGNPKPRVFRAIPEEGIVNRMGFNNRGALVFADRLAAWRAAGRWPRHPVGINLGKSKIAPLEKAAEDYAATFRHLWSHVDFFVVNVSSPNTPNLRALQDRRALDEILAALQEVNARQARLESGSRTPNNGKPTAKAEAVGKPILVKVAPDLTFEAMDEILELVAPRRLAGIVATNTTISRPETTRPEVAKVYQETGGLSGRPLRARSTEVIRHLYRQSQGRIPIIGVGGIFTAEDAWEKITAGACLVQVYTGFVYEGPGTVRTIVQGLHQKLATEGLRRIDDAVGLNAK